MGHVSRWYCKFFNFFGCLGSPILLFMRLYWGYQFMMTGYGKLRAIDPVVAFFESLAIPFPEVMAWLVGFFECVGGLMLMIGLLSRFWGLSLSVIMLTAYATAHQAALWSLFSDPNVFVTESPFMFLLTSLMVLVWGPGFFSLDCLAQKKLNCEEEG